MGPRGVASNSTGGLGSLFQSGFQLDMWVFPKMKFLPPKSSILYNRVFHYKPSILGYHYFWKRPPNGPGFSSSPSGKNPAARCDLRSRLLAKRSTERQANPAWAALEPDCLCCASVKFAVGIW